MGAILFWTDMKRLFNWNMNNFKSNFLSRGQPGSKSIDKFFLSVLKMWPCYKYFFGNLIFALTARTLSGNRLYVLSNTFSDVVVCFTFSAVMFVTFVTGAPSQSASSVSSCGIFTLCLLLGFDGWSKRWNQNLRSKRFWLHKSNFPGWRDKLSLYFARPKSGFHAAWRLGPRIPQTAGN